MGAMAPYFSVYPLPAKLPINAAILASQHMTWEVSVDGCEVVVEPFGGLLAIRPVHGWPADRALEVVARNHGQETRHPFHTGTTAHTEPPRCEWTGPLTIDPKSPMPPPDSWPTNTPRPPQNQRTFPIPPVISTAGYLVSAQLVMRDRGRTWKTEVGLSSAATTTVEPGHPMPSIALTPYDPEFSDDAQVIGMILVDVAGNRASYGTT